MAKITFKHRLEYYALRVLAIPIRRLSHERAVAFGGRLGILAGMLLPKRRKLTQDNLRRAYPQWSERKVRTTAWTNFQQLGIGSVEMLRMDMFRCGGDDVARYFVLDGIEHLRQAMAMERGVIVLTGHFGFWEAGHFVLPALGIPCHSVAKPLKNPLADTYFNNIREAFGAKVLNSRHGARKILKALQQQSTVAILLDQHISPPGSVATEFFGRKAYTTTAIANLAMKFKVPVVPMFCYRQKDGRYRICAEPMLMLEGRGEQAVVENTQKLTDIIETAVRREPSQWFWMHKRWRVEEREAALAQQAKEETVE